MSDIYDDLVKLYTKSSMLNKFYPKALEAAINLYSSSTLAYEVSHGSSKFFNCTTTNLLHEKMEYSIERYFSATRTLEKILQVTNASRKFQPYGAIDFYFSSLKFNYGTTPNDDVILDGIEVKTREVIETIVGWRSATQEDVAKVEESMIAYLNQIIANNSKIPRPTLVKLLKAEILPTLIAIIITLISFATDNSASRQDVGKVKEDMLDKIDLTFRSRFVIKNVLDNFRIRDAPRYSAKKKAVIDKQTQVEVLDSDSGWAKIRFIDSQGFPVEGWMPRTCLK